MGTMRRGGSMSDENAPRKKSDDFAAGMRQATDDYYAEEQERERRRRKRERIEALRNWFTLLVMVSCAAVAITYRAEIKTFVARFAAPPEEDGSQGPADLQAARGNAWDPRVRALGVADEKIQALGGEIDKREAVLDDLSQ